MLSVARLIQVSVNAGAQPAVGRSFNTLMIAGDSPVISGLQRFRSYNSIEDVGNDFGTTTPEWQAADVYFEQVPQPTSLMIGRWLSSATGGYNLGSQLSVLQQALSNFTGITSGGFKISVNGAALESVTGLNFSAVTNLNGVASVINGALTGATCTWNGSSFVITSSTTGAGANASGYVLFTGNPAANDTLTVNGTVITFVASSPVGSQVVIGANESITFANLLNFLQQSLDSNISQATYAADAVLTTTQINITAKNAGTAGNSFSLVHSSSVLTLSGADLSGGVQPSTIGYAVPPASGTDISTLLGLTAATSQGLASGYNAETPVQCATALATQSNVWYGLHFAATASISTAQYLAVASYIEALSVTRMFGVTSQDTNCSSSVSTNDIAALFESAGYDQSFVQFSSTNAYAAVSIFGRMFSVDFTAQNSTIDLMYKQEPGIVPESLTDTQANALQAKNCNVFVGYDNATAIIQYGNVSSGLPIDQVWGLDWLQNAIQTAVYNVLYTSTTKIPQTDAGQNQLVNAVSQVCGNQPGGAVYNSLAGPGVWNSSTVFGALQTGQYLTLGYYVYTASVNLQSESDRAARKAPPIQVALKLAGAFRTADVIVTVNQ